MSADQRNARQLDVFPMSNIDLIKAAIANLPEDEVAQLRVWLAEFDAARFDEQIERDAAAGKLDAMMDAARANAKAGRRWEL